MTMGLLSWQLWIITGFMILVFAIFEYSFRRNEVEPSTNSLVNPTAANDQAEPRRLFTQDRVPHIVGSATLFVMITGITVSYLYNRAAGFPSAQPYQQETKLPNNDKLVSTAFRNVFKCQSPDTELTQKEKDKVLAYFQQEEKIIEELYGIVVKLNDDGSVEIYPLDSHSFKFGPMKKMVLERHRVDDKYIIVIVRYEFEEDPKKPNFLYRVLGLFPVSDDPKVRNTTREMVEKMLGVDNKACQLI
jgi:hypothetical protein